MAKAAKKTDGSSPDPTDLSYGEALARLEAIVEAMEEDNLPLEELLTRYEEGRRLADLCQTRLAKAELRIQQLESTTGGGLALSELTPENPADADAPADAGRPGPKLDV